MDTGAGVLFHSHRLPFRSCRDSWRKATPRVFAKNPPEAVICPAAAWVGPDRPKNRPTEATEGVRRAQADLGIPREIP